ncbi:MAG TPA: sensory rhodopsin transducer [Solirubrobacterales bacterium]|nr:sensory rhodopsin transducer [Solirubrobacterales bacterium]
MRNVNPLSNEIIGAHAWAIPESLIPSARNGNGAGPPPEEVVSLLNAGGAHAHVEITILFDDRDPTGPYQVVVPALRTLRLRFSDLADSESIPRDTPYAAVIESDEPIVVQRGLPLSPVPQIQVVQ